MYSIVTDMQQRVNMQNTSILNLNPLAILTGFYNSFIMIIIKLVLLWILMKPLFESILLNQGSWIDFDETESFFKMSISIDISIELFLSTLALNGKQTLSLIMISYFSF